jgi:hypothetical protein
MRQKRRIVAFVFVSLMGLAMFAGCAAQTAGTDGFPDNPKLLQDELEEVTMDLENVQEMLVANRVEQQMEDGDEIRKTIRGLEMDLYNLRGRKSALEERIAELKAAGKL